MQCLEGHTALSFNAQLGPARAPTELQSTWSATERIVLQAMPTPQLNDSCAPLPVSHARLRGAMAAGVQVISTRHAVATTPAPLSLVWTSMHHYCCCSSAANGLKPRQHDARQHREQSLNLHMHCAHARA
eukprot:8705788-Lingulodinium_polyedra.AAC.1